jgi:uncharacterized membrane protein
VKAFRWSYILLPAIILLLSIVLVAWFYRLLPGQMGYHFLSDGSADRWAGRGAIVLWAVLPQVLLTLVALGITRAITWLLGRAGGAEEMAVRPQSMLLVTGNMVALPQIILFFAMLDIFSYNAYQVHWLPLWVLILIVAGVGALILGVYFLRTLLRVWKAKKE